MIFLKSSRAALAAVAALAILAGCGGGSQPLSPVAANASAITFNAAPALHPNRGKSWMLPGAQKQPSLLYISNSGTADVTVYTYLNGSGLLLVGTLTGFSLPTGMCTDRAGHIWIPDYSAGKIYEYAHGGTSPIATITQQNGRPYDCAIDSSTGNLAVANQLPNGRYSYGNVKVYPKGSKRGTTYFPPYGFRSVDFLAYDNKSNLFVDGQELYQPSAQLFELAKGANELTTMTIDGGALYAPAAINWIKPTLLLGDQNFENKGTSGAYKLFISGSTATVVATLTFSGTQQMYGFWRRAGRVIVPDHTGNIVRIYDLSDGSLFSKLTTSISLPFGAVVSQST
ncbi:MAG: hypothetical protein WB615_07770 [Candidatus Tumulicola sp.]